MCMERQSIHHRFHTSISTKGDRMKVRKIKVERHCLCPRGICPHLVAVGVKKKKKDVELKDHFTATFLLRIVMQK